MEEYYLMWLSRVKGIGFQRYQILLEHFLSAHNIWNAKKKDFLDIEGIPKTVVNSIIASKNPEVLDMWIEELEEKEIQFYSYYHFRYPTLLKEIYDPPMGIYIRGELPEDEIDKVAVIGARKCSRYGATMSYEIAKDLGKTNVIVVSGMARGIDSMAHKGVLDGGGRTIAVLGSGVDICYPSENKELMEIIVNNGCVMSEFPPGTGVHPSNFPQRNRIISGLSKILVVIEAGKKSGTKNTVDLALENGREVFALPGNVTSWLSEGTNSLIKQGCRPITEGNDILLELNIAYGEEEKIKFSQKTAIKLSYEECEVFDLIPDKEPVLVQDICNQLDKSIQEVQYILSLLEIAELISKVPQAGYIRES